jgi:hypothetical protein
MADETRQIDVIMGPYRGHRLTMTTADADSAINNHWAVEPHVLPPDPDDQHPPLTEEERTTALEAATTWAQLQWDTAQGVAPPDPPPPEGGEGGVTRKRAMKPDEDEREGYKTRQVSEPKEPHERAGHPDHPKR